MNFDWIGPAVTAAIITATVTLYLNHRQHSLNYITSEHSSWRSRIKNAIQELLSASKDPLATKLALQKIKSELNPYGRFAINEEVKEKQKEQEEESRRQEKEQKKQAKKQKSKKRSKVGQEIAITSSKHKKRKKKSIDNDFFYLCDGHIWTTISVYEENPNNQKALDTLVILLELLLKFDWERSKREVSGFAAFLPGILVCTLGSISFAFGTVGNDSMQHFLFGVGLIEVISLLCAFLPPYLLFHNSASYQPKNIWITLSSIFVMLPGIVAYFLFFAGNKKLPFFIAAVAFFFAAVLSISISGKRDKERKYINMIRKVYNQEQMENIE